MPYTMSIGDTKDDEDDIDALVCVCVCVCVCLCVCWMVGVCEGGVAWAVSEQITCYFCSCRSSIANILV